MEREKLKKDIEIGEKSNNSMLLTNEHFKLKVIGLKEEKPLEWYTKLVGCKIKSFYDVEVAGGISYYRFVDRNYRSLKEIIDDFDTIDVFERNKDSNCYKQNLESQLRHVFNALAQREVGIGEITLDFVWIGEDQSVEFLPPYRPLTFVEEICKESQVFYDRNYSVESDLLMLEKLVQQRFVNMSFELCIDIKNIIHNKVSKQKLSTTRGLI